MALTTAQQLSCFEIAGVIYADTAKLHNGFGVELTLSDMDTLKTALTTYLTGLSSDSEAKIAALVTEWESIRLNVGRMDGGSIGGGITGASYSWDDKRENIKRLFNVYVPVMHVLEAQKRRANLSATQSSNVIPISLS